MNYKAAYQRFIAKAKAQNLKDGFATKKAIYKRKTALDCQIHHIKPRSLGGSSEIDNLVLLSPEDHIYAHCLLDLSLYQSGNKKALERLDYHYGKIKKKDMLKRTGFRKLKVEMQFNCKKSDKPLVFTLMKAAKYIAFIQKFNPDNEKDVLKCVAKCILIAKRDSSYAGITMKLLLPS